MADTQSAVDWQEQFGKITDLLNIARIAIFCSLLIFLAVLDNMAGYKATTANYLPLIRNQNLLYIWCTVYGLLIMFSLAKPQWQHQKIGKMPNASAVIDISMMAVLTYLSGGVHSGFGILLLPFLATSCLLSRGKFPLLYGSYASFLVLADVYAKVWPFTQERLAQNLNLLTDQILLVAACYTVPLVTSLTARYLSGAERVAHQNRADFERISALNRIVLNRVQEAVVVADTASMVWMYNSKAHNYFEDLGKGSYAGLFAPIMQIWRAKPQQSFEHLFDLNGRRMHVRAVPLNQGDDELLMLFIRSEQERLDEAQAVKLASLGLLTANLAHELRNPLSAMRQANGMLAENLDPNDDWMLRMAGIVEKNISRIDRMIEDISVINKQDRLKPEAIHIVQFWLHFTQEFYWMHPEARGSLKLDAASESLSVWVDATHLQQIMINLVNNAWRHCSKGKNAIVLTVRPLEGNRISLRLWDDGPGVSEAILPRLFEPFNSSETENKGTGLGLYLAHELAQVNKGDLNYLKTAKSFELILPRAQT